MNGIAITGSTIRSAARALDRAAVRPVYLALATLVAVCIPVSLIWDFSWESTIGIDRFWSPPHVATHVSVWMGGLLGVWLVAVFTVARRRGERAAGVAVGPLCAPSGAWLMLWGAMVMQTALLFDNWWQQAYGLGAGSWHPPQLLKTVGFFAIIFGSPTLCAGAQSGESTSRRTASLLLILCGGALVTMCALVLMMSNYPNRQHAAWFYKISCAVYPLALALVRRASPLRWAATLTALAYMLIAGAMVWVLPLFSAQPLTGPIHQPTDHFMPPPFPLLLALPALAIDLAHSWLAKNSGREWLPAVAMGVGFFAVFFVTQWFFAEFLLSPAADNRLFAGGGRHWPFFLKIDQARIMFWGTKQDPMTWTAALIAIGLAILSARTGLWAGNWLSRLRR